MVKKIVKKMNIRGRYESFILRGGSSKLKDVIYKLVSNKNPFSKVKKLKGYRVGRKIFPATRKGYVEVNVYASQMLNKKKNVRIIYLY